MRARRYAAGAVAWVAVGLAWWVGRRRERADELGGIRARLDRLEAWRLDEAWKDANLLPGEREGHENGPT